MKKNAIALLITVMFVLAITASIAFGLKKINTMATLAKEDISLYQNSSLMQDVLKILRTSPEIQKFSDAKNANEFFTFLHSSAHFPLQMKDTKVIISLQNARAKFNLSSLAGKNIEQLKKYFNTKMVNPQYVDILLDAMSGVKEDNNYNTPLFNEHPNLFRDYIASQEQIDIINTFYKKEYHTNDIDTIAFEKLFYYSHDKNTSIDLNFATPQTWELMLSCSKERAKTLALNAGEYKTKNDLNLDTTELENLETFHISFFEPILLVTLDISKEAYHTVAQFEYNIKTKEVDNFAYKI